MGGLSRSAKRQLQHAVAGGFHDTDIQQPIVQSRTRWALIPHRPDKILDFQHKGVLGGVSDVAPPAGDRSARVGAKDISTDNRAILAINLDAARRQKK